jgi:hypothetical protein
MSAKTCAAAFAFGLLSVAGVATQTDPKGYRAAVERAEQNYLEQLQKERQSPPSR